MAGEADIVTVEPSGLKALGRPNFIIEGADGKFRKRPVVWSEDGEKSIMLTVRTGTRAWRRSLLTRSRSHLVRPVEARRI